MIKYYILSFQARQEVSVVVGGATTSAVESHLGKAKWKETMTVSYQSNSIQTPKKRLGSISNILF